MNTIHFDQDNEGKDLEQLLKEARIAYAVIDRCPLATCEACRAEHVSAAA